MQRRCTKNLQHRFEDDDDGSICFHLAKTGFYIQELDRIGLWPIPNATTPKSIQQISSGLLRFANYPVSDVWEDDMQCDGARIDFERCLRQVRRSVATNGLCLNCVKKGKIMIADGNCQAASLDKCKNLF